MAKVGSIDRILLSNMDGLVLAGVNYVDDVWPAYLNTYRRVELQLIGGLVSGFLAMGSRISYGQNTPEVGLPSGKQIILHAHDNNDNRFAQIYYVPGTDELTRTCCQNCNKKYFSLLHTDTATIEDNRPTWWQSLRRSRTTNQNTITIHPSRNKDLFYEQDPPTQGIVSSVDQYMTPIPAHPRADVRSDLCHDQVGDPFVGPKNIQEAGNPDSDPPIPMVIPRVNIPNGNRGGFYNNPKYEIKGVLLYPYAFTTPHSNSSFDIQSNPMKVSKGVLPQTPEYQPLPDREGVISPHDPLLDGWVEFMVKTMFGAPCHGNDFAPSAFTYQEDWIGSFFIGPDTGTLYGLFGTKSGRGKSYEDIRDKIRNHLRPRTTDDGTAWIESTEDRLRHYIRQQPNHQLDLDPLNPITPQEVLGAVDRVSNSFDIRGQTRTYRRAENNQ